MKPPGVFTSSLKSATYTASPPLPFWNEFGRELLESNPMTLDLFLRCLELVTTGLCRSSSSLHGGPSWSPKDVFGSCSVDVPPEVGVHSPRDPDQFVNDGTGSES